MTTTPAPVQHSAVTSAPVPEPSSSPTPSTASRRELAARWLVAHWPVLAAVALVAVLFDLLTGGPVTRVLDPWVRNHLLALPHTGPDLAVAHVLDHTGKITVVTPVVVAVAAWASWRQRSWSSLQMAVGTLFGMLAVVAVVKFGLARGLAINGDPSLFVQGGQAFPSGHASQAAAAAGLLVALLPRALGRGMRRSTALLLVAVPCAVMTSVSLYLGFHWTSDLVAGTLCGLLAVRAGLAVERRAALRRAEHRIGIPPLGLFLGTEGPVAEPFDVRDDAEPAAIERPGPRAGAPSASVAA